MSDTIIQKEQGLNPRQIQAMRRFELKNKKLRTNYPGKLILDIIEAFVLRADWYELYYLGQILMKLLRLIRINPTILYDEYTEETRALVLREMQGTGEPGDAAFAPFGPCTIVGQRITVTKRHSLAQFLSAAFPDPTHEVWRYVNIVKK